jgi:hypothetical protein
MANRLFPYAIRSGTGHHWPQQSVSYCSHDFLFHLFFYYIFLPLENTLTKEADKILKYKGLLTEAQSTWNVKLKVITTNTSATECQPRTFQKYLEHIRSYIPEKNCAPPYVFMAWCLIN